MSHEDSHRVRPGLRASASTLLAVSAVALTACGGGGSGSSDSKEVLHISVQYASNAYLFRASSIVPAMSGFNGHASHCSWLSGTLPAGMTLRDNCSITGTPTEAGDFTGTVHVTAEGADGYVDYLIGFTVIGPASQYVIGAYYVGDVIDASPTPSTWQPEPSTTIRYSVGSGTLPAGVTLDPVTGRLYGVATTPVDVAFRIDTLVTETGMSATLHSPPVGLTYTTVSKPFAGYGSAPTPWLGFPFSLSPEFRGPWGAAWSFSTDPSHALPPGLSLDPASGVISGVITQQPSSPTYSAVNFTMQANGLTYSGSAMLPSLVVASPVLVRTSFFCHAGTYCSAAPSYTFQGPTLSGATYKYAAQSSWLPQGLSLDPDTGVLSGTPTTVGTTAPQIYVTVYVNGTSFVQQIWLDYVVLP